MLFTNILGIGNANWTDYRDTLLQFKRRQTSPPDIESKVIRIYLLIAPIRLSDEDWISLL
jgi:hypothetical protein